MAISNFITLKMKSDKVRKNEAVSMEIPFVGTFIVRGGVAAV